MLAVFNTRDQITFRGTIAAQFISDENARLSILFDQFTHEALCRFGIPARLDKDIQDVRCPAVAACSDEYPYWSSRVLGPFPLVSEQCDGPSMAADLGDFSSGCAKLRRNHRKHDSIRLRNHPARLKPVSSDSAHLDIVSWSFVPARSSISARYHCSGFFSDHYNRRCGVA